MTKIVKILMNDSVQEKFAFIPQICSLAGGRDAIDVVLMGYNPWLNILESPSVEQKSRHEK